MKNGKSERTCLTYPQTAYCLYCLIQEGTELVTNILKGRFSCTSHLQAITESK